MSIKKRLVGLVVGMSFLAAVAEEPAVSFTGYLDADVWGDLTGAYYTNNELDLGMTLTLSAKVSAHVYATVWSANGEHTGSVPAGVAPPNERWLPILFDGYDITYQSDIGTFTVGDLVYQYGKFNYYFYKRLSMITPESFTRGIKYSFGSGMVSQDFTAGISDLNSSTADIQGSTNLTFGETGSLGIYYGVKNDARMGFKEGSDLYAGAEYLGSIGENISVKADVGYLNMPGDEGTNVVSLLLEPMLTVGSFSTAFTGFVMFDGDTLVNSVPLFNLADEMFFYVEPGYTFSDLIGAGLPLEFHAGNMTNKNDDMVWVVPTLYIYPQEKVQWWIWGQVVIPTAEDSDMAYGIGSEIIVTF